MPRRVERLPAATLRMTTSSGMISTSRISCSRMFSRRMKWVGTPISARRIIRYSLMRLFSTPLPVMVPFFCALNAVASSLKYCTRVPGSGPSKRIFALPLVDLTAARHDA
jgi:hypothetical protein